MRCLEHALNAPQSPLNVDDPVFSGLEAPQILFGRRVGRPPKGSCEAPDMADITPLRVRPQTAHHHIVLHALAQWADRS
jgi:hypothetical protein